MFRERVLTKSPILNVMIEAAFKAGRSLTKDFGEVEKLQVSQKGTNDFVSNADERAEKIIRITLEKARPGFNFLMEESGAHTGEQPDHRWIVDPLDGTTNFLHGLPGFCVSIAYEHKGDIVAGVVYDPLLDELFFAEKGLGAFLNTQRLRVSGRKKTEGSLCVTGFHSYGDEAAKERFLKRMHNMIGAKIIGRGLGSSALSLAYVAAGRVDGYFEESLRLWDVAAGKILVEESRGIIKYSTQGDRVSRLLAAPIDLYEKLDCIL